MFGHFPDELLDQFKHDYAERRGKPCGDSSIPSARTCHKGEGATVNNPKRVSKARLDREINATIRAMKGAKGFEALRLKMKLAELKAERREPGKAQLGGA